ncbi:NAD(P)-binding protein [Morchella conica CCBAS932]|uniref:NAD(P)-binding protein n=1 Tax=Morchella conica CCBAS932 TaxID=1392247 RepID=A0A3N4KCK2_9PEZI|nr:NAD(P)-binding protein [Morchella conica CCBAS932]
MVQNKAIVFKSVPHGYPNSDNLRLETLSVDLDAVPAGGMILKNGVVSFDPYMRGRMRPAETKSYSAAFALNAPIDSAGVSKVVKSDSPDFKVGDIVTGHVGMEEYAVVPKERLGGFKVLDNKEGLPPSYYLGILGMPGLTAYSSFYEIGKPKKGETIFVSAASGAVGAIVGQLAKREGLRVVGSAGTDEKVAFLKSELGFDAAFNYKTESPFAALKKHAPEGIDIYYDNVGGETLDAALDAAKDFARFIECGMISQYNLKSKDEIYGLKNTMQIVAKRLTIRGFIVSDKDFGPKYSKEHQENIRKWLVNKEFVYRETVTEGLENAVDGFVGMLKGENFGKASLKIADLE